MVAAKLARKREPEFVREFLTQHKDVLPARIKREVTNKLDLGLKKL